MGVLIFANGVCHVVLILCATFLQPVGGSANLQTEESLASREYAKHGGAAGPGSDVALQVDDVRSCPHDCQHVAWQHLQQELPCTAQDDQTSRGAGRPCSLSGSRLVGCHWQSPSM